jgi:hypothetical protein
MGIDCQCFRVHQALKPNPVNISLNSALTVALNLHLLTDQLQKG